MTLPSPARLRNIVLPNSWESSWFRQHYYWWCTPCTTFICNFCQRVEIYDSPLREKKFFKEIFGSDGSPLRFYSVVRLKRDWMYFTALHVAYLPKLRRSSVLFSSEQNFLVPKWKNSTNHIRSYSHIAQFSTFFFLLNMLR